MPNFFTHYLLSFLLTAVISTSSHALEKLEGTIFEQAGIENKVDPVLLYSIAIAESAVSGNQRGRLMPSPWTLRTDKPFYGRTKEETEQELLRLLETRKSVDIGIMQVNWRWHGHRVKKPTDLLDPLTNVRIGARILSENFKRFPNDAVMAIGSYHSLDKERAKRYATHVLRIYTNIKSNGWQ